MYKIKITFILIYTYFIYILLLLFCLLTPKYISFRFTCVVYCLDDHNTLKDYQVTPVAAASSHEEQIGLSAFHDIVCSSTTCLNERMANAFNGKSLTVSVSSSKQVAHQTCVNPSKLGNDLCMASNNGQFGLVSHSKHAQKLDLDTADVLTLLPGFEHGEQSIVATTGDDAFHLDLTQPVLHEFFSELNNIYRLFVTLSNGERSLNQLVVDSVPDSYTFTFSTLEQIADDFTVTSQEYITARQLLHAALPHFIANARELYPEAMVEVALISSSSSASPDQTGPHRALLDVVTTDGEVVTDQDVARYQIVLWFSISFTFVLFFALTSIVGMSFKKDTLMYGDFNPEWSAAR